MPTRFVLTITTLALIYSASPAFGQAAVPEIVITDLGFQNATAGAPPATENERIAPTLSNGTGETVRLSIPLLGGENYGAIPTGWTAGLCRLPTEIPCIWRVLAAGGKLTLDRDKFKGLLIQEPATIHVERNPG